MAARNASVDAVDASRRSLSPVPHRLTARILPVWQQS